jgi:hypothetical protein
MNPHKYWRLLIQDNNGGDTVELFELALTTHANSLNLLPPNTNFFATMPAQNNEKVFEFSTPFAIGGYSFKAQGATAPKAWRLEYSDNKADWQLAHLEYAKTRWQTNEIRRFEVALFELNLSINGSIAAPFFNLLIHDVNGELILKKIVQNGTESLLMPSDNAVSVTLVQGCGNTWQAGRYYKTGALVLPKNPTTTPFYYRNRHGGISDLIQPNWQTNPEIFTVDSGCLWEVVERLNQPITQFPLIPTRKL